MYTFYPLKTHAGVPNPTIPPTGVTINGVLILMATSSSTAIQSHNSQLREHIFG